MAGTVRATEAAPPVSGAGQGLGVETKETPRHPGPGQEGGAGAPQAEASDPARAGPVNSKPSGAITGCGQVGGLSCSCEVDLPGVGDLRTVPSPLWASPPEYQGKGWTRSPSLFSPDPTGCLWA